MALGLNGLGLRGSHWPGRREAAQVFWPLREDSSCSYWTSANVVVPTGCGSNLLKRKSSECDRGLGRSVGEAASGSVASLTESDSLLQSEPSLQQLDSTDDLIDDVFAVAGKLPKSDAQSSAQADHQESDGMPSSKCPRRSTVDPTTSYDSLKAIRRSTIKISKSLPQLIIRHRQIKMYALREQLLQILHSCYCKQPGQCKNAKCVHNKAVLAHVEVCSQFDSYVEAGMVDADGVFQMGVPRLTCNINLPSCTTFKQLLFHYRNCNSLQCTLCGPVIYQFAQEIPINKEQERKSSV